MFNKNSRYHTLDDRYNLAKELCKQVNSYITIPNAKVGLTGRAIEMNLILQLKW